MSPWFSSMLVATLTGSLATVVVLVLCRVSAVTSPAKVWLCRALLVKWPLGLATGFGFVLGPSVATRSSEPARWVGALTAFVFVLWLVGAGLHLFDAYRAWAVCRRAVLSAPLADQGERLRVGRLAESVAVGSRFDVRIGEGVPALVMAAPRLVLALPPGASDFVVLHELAHLRHRDLAWTGLAALIHAAFWFNPLLERLVRELRFWQDVSADSCAIALSGTSPASAAADVLRGGASEPGAAPVLALGSESALFARRFREMYARRKGSLAGAALVLVGLVSMSPVALTRANEPPTELWTEVPARSLAAPTSSYGARVPIASMAD